MSAGEGSGEDAQQSERWNVNSSWIISLFTWPTIPWALVILAFGFGVAGGLWIRQSPNSWWIAVVMAILCIVIVVGFIIPFDQPYDARRFRALPWLRLGIVTLPSAFAGSLLGCALRGWFRLGRYGTAANAVAICLLAVLYYRETVEAIEQKMPRCMCRRSEVTFGGYYYLEGANPPCPSRGYRCISRLKQIGLALAMYADAHAGGFPRQNGLNGLLELRERLPLERLLICPSDKARVCPTEGSTWTEQSISYVYRGGLSWCKTNEDSAPVCWDKPGNHGTNGLNVLFTDGHVMFLSFEQWEKIAPKAN